MIDHWELVINPFSIMALQTKQNKTAQINNAMAILFILDHCTQKHGIKSVMVQPIYLYIFIHLLVKTIRRDLLTISISLLFVMNCLLDCMIACFSSFFDLSHWIKINWCGCFVLYSNKFHLTEYEQFSIKLNWVECNHK